LIVSGTIEPSFADEGGSMPTPALVAVRAPPLMDEAWPVDCGTHWLMTPLKEMLACVQMGTWRSAYRG